MAAAESHDPAGIDAILRINPKAGVSVEAVADSSSAHGTQPMSITSSWTSPTWPTGVWTKRSNWPTGRCN